MPTLGIYLRKRPDTGIRLYMNITIYVYKNVYTYQWAVVCKGTGQHTIS